MNNHSPAGKKWRILIVEDEEHTARQLQEMAPGCADEPDEVETETCATFGKAAEQLRIQRFDLLILDLKDNNDISVEEDHVQAGLVVFQKLKMIRFIPVVFYTALAHTVRSEETSFVRVVEKTEGVTRVRAEIRRILATRLPSLMRHIDDFQRDYMWDFISKHWKEFDTTHAQADVAYLLARRLALSLEKEAGAMAQKMTGEPDSIAGNKKIHPMEMYICPPMSANPNTGDLISEINGAESVYWLVLTPSCDFEHKGRIHKVLLAQCVPLEKELEYTKWKTEQTAQNLDALKSLIGDNRKNAQPERFKFLPGTYLFADSVVDFQKLKAVSSEDLGTMKTVASLDSPFAEAVLARFSRYFGRLGTPDIDKDLVIKRLQAQAAITLNPKPGVS